MAVMSTDRSKSSHHLSVRISEAMLDDLEAVARVDGTTLGAVVREAIGSYTESRTSAPAWNDQIEKQREALKELLVKA
jgi:hypothetical protein